MRRATLKLKSSLLAVTEQLKRQFPEQKTKELGRNDHRISVRKSCSRPKADMKGEDFDSSNPCRNRRVTGNPKFRLETANGAQKTKRGRRASSPVPGQTSISRLWPLAHRYILRRIHRADVVCPRPDQPVVIELLDHVRSPAADSAYCEDRCVEIDVNAQRRIG